MNPAQSDLSAPDAAAPPASTPWPPEPPSRAAAERRIQADEPGEAEYASWMRLIRLPFG